MRAVVADAFGPPSSLILRNVAVPVPGPGEVRISVAAAGVTFVDALITSGGHQGAINFPFIPGTECAGVIDAVGPDVEHLSEGQHVFAVTLRGGSFADQVVVDASLVALAPAHIGFDRLAIVGGTYFTAYHALVHRAFGKGGERLLVRGAAGALGSAAIQLGRALGMEVFAAASTPEKRDFARRAGANIVFDSSGGDVRGALKSALADEKIDIAFDPVGGSDATEYFRVLAWRGRYLVLGFAGGAIPTLPFNLALLKGASLVGVDAGQAMQRDAALTQSGLAHLSELLGSGKIAPHVATRLRLDDFSKALELASTGTSVGRIILEMKEN